LFVILQSIIAVQTVLSSLSYHWMLSMNSKGISEKDSLPSIWGRLRF
jgi:hypothetical protein